MGPRGGVRIPMLAVGGVFQRVPDLRRSVERR
jgi:hypothetical protein